MYKTILLYIVANEPRQNKFKISQLWTDMSDR